MNLPACFTTVTLHALAKVSAKVKPNEPCPCGSGKKYKKCCMGKK